MLEASGLKAGRDFFLAFSPERVDPGQRSSTRRGTFRRSSAASGRRAPRRRARCTGDRRRHGRAGQLDARRRDGQAAREHVPRREHRPRQRDRADVPQDGHRRLGSDRRGEDQAVRLHAVLSRARAWAATASRSIRSTCRGRRGRTASSAASSSWPARSTRSMPEYVVERVAEALNTRAEADQRIAHPPVRRRLQADVSDMRESPALDILELLRRRGADADLHRPVRAGSCTLPRLTRCRRSIWRRRWSSRPTAPSSAPITPASTTTRWSPSGTLVVDTRNALKDRRDATIFRL